MGVVGLVVGAFVGGVSTACIAGYAVWHSATTSLATVVDPVIRVAIIGGSVRADSGNGILLPTVIASLVGASISVLAGLVTVMHKRRSESAE